MPLVRQVDVNRTKVPVSVLLNDGMDEFIQSDLFLLPESECEDQ